MTNAVNYRPGSDDLDELTRGYVMANRINDVWANPNSKRHQSYLALVRDQFLGEPVVDHNDQYREQSKELLPRALQAYEQRHGVTLRRGILYFQYDSRLAAAPDAVESPLIGLTVHIRQSLETYQQGVDRGVTADMERHAIAMMLVSGIENWLHLDYWEDANLRRRKLHEHLVEWNELHAAELEEVMIGFALKSRLRAVG